MDGRCALKNTSPRSPSCVHHVYTLGKIIQGRKDAGLMTYCFFLDVQKA